MQWTLHWPCAVWCPQETLLANLGASRHHSANERIQKLLGGWLQDNTICRAQSLVRNAHFAPCPQRNLKACQNTLHWYCLVVIFFQLYGYCYQDSNDIPDTLTTITELGSPLEMIQLLQTSWEDRFRVSNNGFKRTFKRVMNTKKHQAWNKGGVWCSAVHIY